MQLALQLVSYAIGLPLEVLTMSAMLRGQWRHYPFVFLYLMGDFVTTLLEIRPGLVNETASAAEKKAFAWLYWWDERVMQVLVFLLVISLIYRAAAHLKSRNLLVAACVCGILFYAGVTYLISYDATLTTGTWMNPWLRHLNFSAAILDLGLWALLIGAKRKDHKLLMVSGALGIQFTLGAIGQALRYISHSSVQVTGYLIACSSTACIYIFWQAFRLPAERKLPASPAPREKAGLP
ncbi:MAG: hypothetical protein ABI759_23980 [Candidatus Solibacter sp.]